MRILYVEDDKDSRDMVAFLLECSGYEVATVSNPIDALEVAAQVRFGLIILDNWYPDGSGIELCKQIRAFDSHIPIVFYSGAAYHEDIQEGLDAGAQAYLVKPDVGRLKPTIDSLTLPTAINAVHNAKASTV
jgi:DNA-binding response OmpR family regulator